MITGYEQIIQFSVLLKSIGAGFIIGLYYLLFAAANIVSGKNVLTVFIRDIIFFLSSAIFSFLFILKYNSGIIRFYIIAGELIGFLLCYIVLSDAVRKSVGYIYRRLGNMKKVLIEKICRVYNHSKIKTIFHKLRIKIKKNFDKRANKSDCLSELKKIFRREAKKYIKKVKKS